MAKYFMCVLNGNIFVYDIPKIPNKCMGVPHMSPTDSLLISALTHTIFALLIRVLFCIHVA